MVVPRSVRRPRRAVVPFRPILQVLEEREMPDVQPVTLADPSRFGLSGLGLSQFASVSDDGQVVAFQSSAPDLVPNDTNGLDDVFVYFPGTGRLELVSVNATGTGTSTDAAARNPRVSPDGRYVLYETHPGLILTPRQLLARDLRTGQTILVSANSSGTAGNGSSDTGSWSADSTRVVFESAASNFAPNDTNNHFDIFVRDLTAGTTTLASVAQNGTQAQPGAGFFPRLSFNAHISGNNRFVAFESFSNTLGPIDSTANSDVYVKDLQTGAVDLVSIDSAGVNQANANSDLSSQPISADGRYVLFENGSSNLTPGLPFNNDTKTFLRDRVAGTTTAVSLNPAGTAVRESSAGVITPNGRFVAFVSGGPDLDPTVTDTNSARDVFLRDLQTGTTRLVSRNAAGTGSGSGQSGFGFYPNVFTPAEPLVSTDGRFVAFPSSATNLTADPDTNNNLDVFVRDLQTGTTTAVSRGSNGASHTLAASADFRTVVFETGATNLVPGDFNAQSDVVVRNLTAGTTTLVSHRSPQLPPEVFNGGGLWSATPDGRFVAFIAGPSNDLAPNVIFRGFQTASSYVRDRLTGALTVVDLTPDGVTSGGGFNPILTPDGRFVAFVARQPTGGSPPLVAGITFAGPQGGFFSEDVYLRDLAIGVTRIVSVNPTGQFSDNGNNTGGWVAVSDDARYVAFTSNNTNLVAGISNPNGRVAIYQRDLWTNTTVLVSHNVANNGVITGDSTNLVMTPDGRFITFTSLATDLVAGDANNQPDVFRWDRQTGVVSLVSVNAAGTGPGNNDSGGEARFRPVMSADGRLVAFGSSATNLVAGDTNGAPDVFVRDLQSGQTRLVSVNTAGTNGGNNTSSYPVLTPDGRTVVFLSAATNLTATPMPVVATQVLARDLVTNTTRTVSLNAAGTAASNGAAGLSPGGLDEPVVSPDGRYVVFRSQATDLVSGFVDGNGPANADVYVRDLVQGTTQLLTYNQSGTAGAAANNRGTKFFFTTDGPTVVFDSDAPDVLPGDRNAGADVFVFRIEGTAQIRGTIFNDVANPGVFDAGEQGLAGVPVYLDANANGRHDLGEVRLQTDASGGYAFTGLPAGTFRVGVILPDGLRATTPALRTVPVATGTTVVTGQHFGAAAATSDLSVQTVASPTTVAAGRPFTVSWTVANVSANAITGGWQDAVYLSADTTLDASDVLLGTVPHTGGLAAAQSYSRTATLATPGTLADSYFVFVQTDRRRQVLGDTNRANNLARGFDPLAVTIPALTVGTPTADSFTGVSQDRYFQITVQPGQTLRLTLDSAAAAGGTELYASFAAFPTPYEFDHAARVANQPDQTLTIPLTQPGTYYVLAHSRLGAAATANFTITASVVGFGLTGISPNTGGNTGRVTIEVRGTRLTLATQVNLIFGGGVALNPVAVDFRDATLLYATFDLTGRPVGAYDVRAVDGTSSATLPGAFTVQVGQAAADALQLFLSVPARVRAGRQGRVVVEYLNSGSTDIVAPLLRLTSTNATLRLPGQPSFADSDLTFLGIAPDGPAGVLRPGQRGRVEIEFQSTGPAGQNIKAQLFRTDPARVMDWAAIKPTFRPGHIPADAWDAVFANFLAEVGTTVGSYEAMLARNASYLSNLGVYTPDTVRLLNLALDAADSSHSAGSLASVVDADLPNLAFVRSQQQPLHNRYTVGPFGRGWSHNWDAVATTLAAGDVVLRFGASRRFFYRQANGSYFGSAGDTGTLTLAGGVYTLTELGGNVTRFRADSKLDFVADPNGSRITAGYDGSGRLTSLTHSRGAAITLAYSGQGFISSLTDSAGRTVTYTYTGDRLTGYADRFGSHTYTYVTGQGTAREYALASVNFSDDTHATFTYDARGRLIGEERDGGAQRVTYTYLPGGGYTVTDAAGGTLTRLFDDHGVLVREIDPQGRIINFAYDSNRNLTRVEAPGGTVFQYAYDNQGNVAAVIDPAGRQTDFTYDARGNLTAFTDALGRTTNYSYNAANNLLRIDYPNGTHQQFTYNASGDIASATSRRGAVVGYQTNTAGQITRKTYADGSSVSYTYDARGRLATATDAAGTITLAYNALDVLTQVTYPSGRFLRFEYNVVGQRTRSVDQDGFTVNYIYDDPGRLDRLTSGTGALIMDYSYDAAGRLIREDKGNGTASTYAYNLAGDLLTITHLAPGGAVNAKLDYTYDALGRRATMTLTDSDSNTSDGTTTYGYDAVGQLASVALPGGRTIVYEYDAVGNRTSVRDNGVTTAYTTNAANEYTRVGNTLSTYDADGNLVSTTGATGTTTYAYDPENRLVGVSGPGLAASYTYDAFGHRNTATVNGQSTSYLIDPLGLWSVTAEYDATGAALARYASGHGLVSRIGAGGAAYYDFDATGNTVGLTGAAGQYVNRYSYLPFGETTTHSAGVTNPFTFVGRFGVRAEAGGLFNMRMRNYDPGVGQFVSADPIGLNAGDANFRRYVGNAPLSRIDPLGLWNIDFGGSFGVPGFGLAGGLKAGSDGCGKFVVAPYGGGGPGVGGLGAGASISIGGGNVTQGVSTSGSVSIVIPTVSGPYSGNPLFPIIPGHPDNNIGLGAGIGCNVTTTQTFPPLLSISGGDPGNASTGGGSCGCPCDCPPGDDPGGPTQPAGEGEAEASGSIDPNDITGPAGFGTPRFLQPNQPLPYTIRFENVATATAPAQEVFVTHPLDADLDLSTFELGDFGFGSLIIDVPAGRQSYQTSIDFQNPDGSPLRVDVTAELNAETGVVTWTFRALDPLTGLFPEDPLAGFLPPNNATGRGEGFVTYSVRAKPGLVTGTRLDQQASIVFDTNAAIATNVHTNTIDAGRPTSSVQALPPTTSTTTFQVRWSGTDDANGSGIATYDVYVSDNGGAFTIWQSRTTQTQATYTGVAGHTYGFYSVATDNVGFVQTRPTTAQTTTLVQPGGPVTVVSAAVNGGAAQRSMVTQLLVTFSGLVTFFSSPAAAFRLSRTGPGTPTGDVTLAVDLTGSTTTQTIAWLTFSGALTQSNSLMDGNYQLTVLSAQVTGNGVPLDGDGNGTAGGDNVSTLHRLYGDANGDRRVDNADFFQFRTTFGQGTGNPAYLAFLDFDGNGLVDNVDFFQFRIRFGTSI